MIVWIIILFCIALVALILLRSFSDERDWELKDEYGESIYYGRHHSKFYCLLEDYAYRIVAGIISVIIIGAIFSPFFFVVNSRYQEYNRVYERLNK